MYAVWLSAEFIIWFQRGNFIVFLVAVRYFICSALELVILWHVKSGRAKRDKMRFLPLCSYHWPLGLQCGSEGLWKWCNVLGKPSKLLLVLPAHSFLVSGPAGSMSIFFFSQVLTQSWGYSIWPGSYLSGSVQCSNFLLALQFSWWQDGSLFLCFKGFCDFGFNFAWIHVRCFLTLKHVSNITNVFPCLSYDCKFLP
jgi:hypothetical protein